MGQQQTVDYGELGAGFYHRGASELSEPEPHASDWPRGRFGSKQTCATEVHNLSEKTNKASMLDEAIENLKQLQPQVQVNAAAEVIYDLVDPAANLIFGSVIDPSYTGLVSITLIATGFKRQEEGESRSAQAA